MIWFWRLMPEGREDEKKVFTTTPSMSDEDVVRYLRRAEFVGIVGSRIIDFTFRDRVADLIGVMNIDVDACVVTGGAPGVDMWAEDLATERGLRVAVVRPSRRGPHLAGDYFKRNTVIVRGAEIVVAFWNGSSRGTLDSINEAIDFHGYCIVVTDPDPHVAPEIWRRKR
jgi:hypothetical protein